MATDTRAPKIAENHKVSAVTSISYTILSSLQIYSIINYKITVLGWDMMIMSYRYCEVLLSIPLSL